MSDINRIFYKASVNKYHDILEYINPQDISKNTIKNVMIHSAMNHDIFVLEWCNKHLLEVSELYDINIGCAAIDYDNINILEWYVRQNCDINIEYLLNYAFMAGKIKMLDWFYDKNYIINIDNCKDGIMKSFSYFHMKSVLIWLKQHNYLDEFYKKFLQNPNWIYEYKLSFNYAKIIEYFYEVGYKV